MNDEAGMMHLLLLGPPGCGKGTQSEKLVETCGYRQFSTGDILRTEIRKGTELGQELGKIISQGQLIPDALMIRILGPALDTAVDAGQRVLLDGFPRTVAQWEWLAGWLEGRQLDYCALSLEIGPEVLIERLSGRLVCEACGAVYHAQNLPPAVPGQCDRCGGKVATRRDDQPATIRERFEVYDRQTAPVLNCLEERGRLTRIRAERDPEAVFQAVLAAIAQRTNAGK